MRRPFAMTRDGVMRCGVMNPDQAWMICLQAIYCTNPFVSRMKAVSKFTFSSSSRVRA